MKKINLKDVLKEQLIGYQSEYVEYNSLRIDSRLIFENDIFAAFKGNNADGCKFIPEVIEKGAAAIILDDAEYYDSTDKEKIFLVKDVFTAVKTIGKYLIDTATAKIIAITGSVGKTSTKNIIDSIISSRFMSWQSFKNYNNELGTAVSACSIDDEAEYLIFELGTSNPGEILQLAEYIQPNIAIVTNVGHSHIGRFKDQRELAREKLSISYGLKDNGVIWLHDSCKDYLDYVKSEGVNRFIFGSSVNADMKLKKITRGDGKITFEAEYKNSSYLFDLDHVYSHFAYNALPCIGIALNEEIDYNLIYKAVKKFVPVEQRGNIAVAGNFQVINDCYNAGFESVISAVENLSEMTGDRYAVLGEMAEIEGYEVLLYGELKKKIEKIDSVTFLLCGEEYNDFKDIKNTFVFADKEGLIAYLDKIDGGLFLVKASRSRHFEEIVDFILKKGEI